MFILIHEFACVFLSIMIHARTRVKTQTDTHTHTHTHKCVDKKTSSGRCFCFLKQVTRGAKNAQERKDAPKITRSDETAWNKLRKCPFFALQKKTAQIAALYPVLPGARPGPAGDF